MKTTGIRFAVLVALAAMLLTALGGAVYASDTRTVTVTALGGQNKSAQGNELWLRGIVVDGEEIPAYLAFSEGWIEEEGYLKWRAFDQPEGMTGSVTAEVPADAEVSVVFQANMWRGMAQVTDGNSIYTADCYEDTDDPDMAVMVNAGERAPAEGMRVITLSTENEMNANARSSEIWVAGIVIDGTRIAPGKVFSNGWIDEGEYLIWRGYDQPEGMTNAITARVPENAEAYVLFQTNMWRGIVQVTDGNDTYQVDCYSDTEDIDGLVYSGEQDLPRQGAGEDIPVQQWTGSEIVPISAAVVVFVSLLLLVGGHTWRKTEDRQMQSDLKNRGVRILYSSAVFLFMFAYFTRIHPLILFDYDDWWLISKSRYPIPLWGVWNPAKVLPETLMPLCGSIAAKVVYPLTGNYLRAITIVCAAAVSFFIAVYVCMFSSLLGRKFKLSPYQVAIGTTAFFLFHFLIFRKWNTGNQHMLYSPSITNYFHYTIPYLLNASLVMYLMVDDVLDDGWNKMRRGGCKRHWLRCGAWILALYMAIFSSLFCDVLLVAYVGLQLVEDAAAAVRKKRRIGEWLGKNIFRLAVIFLWGVVLIFEKSGGRSGDLSLADGQLMSNIKETFSGFLSIRQTVNGFFILISAVVVAVALAAFFWKEQKRDLGASNGEGALHIALRLVVLSGLLAVYLILLCAVSAPIYINRTDVHFGIDFCLVLAVSLCGAYILGCAPKAVLFTSLAICVMYFATDTRAPTFMDSNAYVECMTGAAVSEDIVEQFVAADEAGDENMELHVPQFNQTSNWPITIDGGRGIAKTLYKHGVIDEEMQSVTVVPDLRKNIDFCIPMPSE